MRSATVRTECIRDSLARTSGLSLDGIVSWAKDAVSLSSFSGANLAEVGHTGQWFIDVNDACYDPNSVLKATLSNNFGVELLSKYRRDKVTFYAGYIYARLSNPSERLSNWIPDDRSRHFHSARPPGVEVSTPTPP